MILVFNQSKFYLKSNFIELHLHNLFNSFCDPNEVEIVSGNKNCVC